MGLGGRSNLFLRGIDGDGIKEAVSTDVEPKRNVHDHGAGLRVRHVVTKQGNRSRTVSHVSGDELRAGLSIEVANDAKKRLVGFLNVPKGVQDSVLVSHCLLSPWARKSLSAENKNARTRHITSRQP
jgi:hypothetical protein